MKHPDEEYWDWVENNWRIAVDEALVQVLDILRARTGQPIDDRDVIDDLRDEIRMAHEMDDPDWSFDLGRLIDTLIDKACGEIDDNTYQLCEYDLDELFPLQVAGG